MGRKLHYRPGSWYQTDDRTGFVQRVERTRKEWDGLLVDQRVWEPRQPQDLVRGVKDNQNVSDARPLGPNVFVGPVETTLAQTSLVQSWAGVLASLFGFTSGDTLAIMLDNGSLFMTVAYADAFVADGVLFETALPYQASSGNVVYNYGFLLPVPTTGFLNDGGVLWLTANSRYPTNPIGLVPGEVWNNGSTVSVIDGTTPNPNAAPLFFGAINPTQLLALGGGNLPTSQPSVANQLWNNGGLVCVASGETDLINDGGVLQLVTGDGYPTSPVGLPAGAVWNNGLTVSVISGTVPNPHATPLYFGQITAGALLALGGANLPTIAPAAGSLQLWNNGGLVCVA